MIYKNKEQILNDSKIRIRRGRYDIGNREHFRKSVLQNLVDTIILSDNKRLKEFCYRFVYNCALTLGVFPASMQPLYRACGRGETGGFCVPAVNLRTLTFEMAKVVFEAGKRIKSNLFIFEIAKSEIGYTWQSPQEYSALIFLAALKQKYKGPVFLQGDHFQIKPAQYRKSPGNHFKSLKKLIKNAVAAGFYNIDIDSSTLVDLTKKTRDVQQKLNYETCAYFTKYIRKIQPASVEVSIGGEIGEVGGANSKPEELTAFMEGYLKKINRLKGISKMSIQTGTKHGGVVLPDGSIAKVKIDFDTLSGLSSLAKNKYKLAGVVQHGASTLPNEAFHHFPKQGCIEIHLATQFQNIVYDYMPLPLKEKIYSWLDEKYHQGRKKDWTDDQFIYRLRKKALGPFKKEIYQLSGELKDKISSVLKDEFLFLFKQLNLNDTVKISKKHIKNL